MTLLQVVTIACALPVGLYLGTLLYFLTVERLRAFAEWRTAKY